MRVFGIVRGCLALGLVSSLLPRGAAAQEMPYTPAPQVAVAPEAESSGHSGFMAMPFLGVHSFQDEDSEGIDPGLRLGVLLGGFVNPSLSLNGEITMDVLNLDAPSSVDVTAGMIDLAFSPLFHAPSGSVEFVIGPKLGFFAFTMEAKSSGRTAKASANGWAYGLNAGLLFPVGSFHMGGLLSFTGRHATKACLTEPGESEVCDDSPSGDDAKVLGFTLAAMF